MIFRPKRFIEIEKEDNKLLEHNENDTEESALKVHKAFRSSLILIVAFAALGILVGCGLQYIFGNPSKFSINLLQILGAGLLLWGTLFVRGFEIQTYYGNTLSERVNQWLYRALYCIGTAIIICSLSWQYA
jgi:uncharacterized membrane protein